MIILIIINTLIFDKNINNEYDIVLMGIIIVEKINIIRLRIRVIHIFELLIILVLSVIAKLLVKLEIRIFCYANCFSL